MTRTKSTHVTEQEVAQPKRGVLGRLFRRSPKESDSKADHRDRTPSPKGSSDDDGTRDEVPEMHPESTLPPSSKPKKVRLQLLPGEPEKAPPTKEETKPSKPLSPIEAAVSGPPKYSWVDIVSLFSFSSESELSIDYFQQILMIFRSASSPSKGNICGTQSAGGLSTQ